MKYRMLSATLLGLAISVLPLGAAVAYIGDNPYIVRLSAPREVGCGESVTITAKVRSSDTSDPAIGQVVLWDLKKALSPDDVVSPAMTSTDSDGRTRAVLTFGQVEGPRTVRVEIAQWPTTIRVSCVGAVAAVTPSPAPSPSASPGATATPTTSPSATPAPSPSPETSASTDTGSLVAAVLPIAIGVLIVLGLGALVLVARRR